MTSDEFAAIGERISYDSKLPEHMTAEASKQRMKDCAALYAALERLIGDEISEINGRWFGPPFDHDCEQYTEYHTKAAAIDALLGGGK